MLDLCCCRSFSLVEVHGLLTAVVSLVAEHGFQSTDSVVVAHGFSCSAAYGIFLDQGSNLCLLHWQTGPGIKSVSPALAVYIGIILSHQGSPSSWILIWEGKREMFKVVTEKYYKCFLCVLSHVRLFVTPWTIACQASLSMEFSRQEYWSGLPFPLPGDLSNSGIKPMFFASPELASRFFTTELPGKPINISRYL